MIASLIDAGLSIIDKILPNKEAAMAAKIKLMQLEQKGELKKIAAQANIITSETNSESILARNWRAIIMLIFGAIIANNYLIGAILDVGEVLVVMLVVASLEGDILELSLTGYSTGRPGNKVIRGWRVS